MAVNSTTDIVNDLMKGLDTVLATKTVVGEATKFGDTIIIPLVDVSFGIGAGTADKASSAGSGGGLTGKMSPSAVLVISNGTTRLVNVKNTDNLSRALDLIPEIMTRVKSNKGATDEEILDAAFPEEDAVKYSQKNSVIRMLVMLVVALVGMKFSLLSFPAVITGMLGLKISAFFQPFTNSHITKKILKKKGR